MVFGTTPDYVKNLHQRYSPGLFFIIDQRFRHDPFLRDVDESDLFFTDIWGSEDTIQPVFDHFKKNHITPVGIACYDCESLLKASEMAHRFGLDFPSYNAIRLARNKVTSKQIWNVAHVPAPRARMVSTLSETLEFFHKIKKEVVLKPISSSGSELLFHCSDKDDILKAVDIISTQLKTRRLNPLFRPVPGDSTDPSRVWVAEEFISGPEFSCDFILLEDRLTILRTTGKAKDNNQSFGSILAYIIPPDFPLGFSQSNLCTLLKRSVISLGFVKGHFMADFIVQEGKPFIVEVTPRPGGDSIPNLLEMATGIDILGLHLGFASGNFPRTFQMSIPEKQYASINLYAPQEGIITELDGSAIHGLPWVKAVFINKQLGDKVVLPPFDYESRKIGYCIVEIKPSWDLAGTQQILQENLKLSITSQPPSQSSYSLKRTSSVSG